jgi:hypothetical protein
VYTEGRAGFAEMQHALELLVERGAGRDAAILQNNLGVARYPLEGPAASLASFETGIDFCEQRGLGESAAQLESNCPGLLAELGRTEEALERASRLAAVLEASGDTHSLAEVRAVELAGRLARGERVAPGDIEWVVETARIVGSADVLVLALSVAAAALVDQDPTQACDLLAELEQSAGACESPYYGRELAAMMRTAHVAGNAALAKRLMDGLEPRYPLDEHALCGAQAQLAEQAGDHVSAAHLYAEAAVRWNEFGNIPERAHALLGQGRCLLAAEPPAAQEPLREARDLLAGLGYKPALAENEALLEQTPAARAS